MSTALAFQDFRKHLDSRAGSLSQWAASTGIDGQTLVRIALRALSDPRSKLRECSPDSIYSALTIAAQLGLEPTGVNGEAHLVPFKGRCQLIPGYQGLIKLAHQSGKVRDVWAEVVRDGDIFQVTKGTKREIIHRPILGDEDAELIAVYACAELEGGIVHFEVMSAAQIEKVRKSSKQGESGTVG
jgi:recombination protein RecT